MAWDPPDHIDIEEVEEAAREMGHLPEKTGEEYTQYLREETDVDVSGVPERVADYLDPHAESVWVKDDGKYFFPAMDLRTDAPFDGKMGPEDWQDHIAILVGQLDLVLPDFDDQYEGTGALDFTDVVRLEVYNQILGFKNAPQLRSHLLRSAGRDDFPVHKILGLEEIPHQNTIRKARKRRFGPGPTEFIKRWARRIEIIGVKRRYRFPEVEDKRLINNGGITDIPIELKRGYAHGALDLARDDMPIAKADNAPYDNYGLHFDFSLHLCDSNGTPDGELENFADNRGLQTYEDIWGDAETFRNDIYRIPIDEWERTFAEWTERLIDTVYDDAFRSRELPIAVDTTNIPTWSNEGSDLPGVIGTEKLSNTHFAYRILSAQAISDGMPFQIAHQLQTTSTNREERLEQLLDAVEDRGFDVGVVFADSEFASGRIVNRLKKQDAAFVIAYPKHLVGKYTSQWEDEEKTFGVEPSYIINKTKSRPDKAEVTLFGEYQSKLEPAEDDAQQTLSEYFDPEAEWVTDRQNRETLSAFEEHIEEDVFEADNRMRWFTFITNLDVNEQQARALRNYYHYRWAIESAYSVYKQHFLPTTKSTNFGLRTYLYLFGMAAYNAWVAANVKCRRQHLEDNARRRPPIRASRFMTIGQQRYRTEEFPADYISFKGN